MPTTDSCEVAVLEDSDATQMSEAFHEEGNSEWKKIKKEICNDLPTNLEAFRGGERKGT